MAFLQASIINLHKNKMLACRKGCILEKKYIKSHKNILINNFKLKNLIF